MRTFIESHDFHSLKHEVTYSWIVQPPILGTITKLFLI